MEKKSKSKDETGTGRGMEENGIEGKYETEEEELKYCRVSVKR